MIALGYCLEGVSKATGQKEETRVSGLLKLWSQRWEFREIKRNGILRTEYKGERTGKVERELWTGHWEHSSRSLAKYWSVHAHKEKEWAGEVHNSQRGEVS